MERLFLKTAYYRKFAGVLEISNTHMFGKGRRFSGIALILRLGFPPIVALR
jgi:hypothetical protein